MLQDEVAEITNMSATDIWLKDLDVLESAWNEFLLKSDKVSGNDHQQLHNNDDDNNNVIDSVDSGLTQPMLNINIDDDDDDDDDSGKF